jgi:hypothetical protein
MYLCSLKGWSISSLTMGPKMQLHLLDWVARTLGWLRSRILCSGRSHPLQMISFLRHPRWTRCLWTASKTSSSEHGSIFVILLRVAFFYTSFMLSSCKLMCVAYNLLCIVWKKLNIFIEWDSAVLSYVDGCDPE